MKEPPQQGGGVYYYPLHFTGKETEAQKSEATYLRSSASTWQEEGKVPTLGVSPTGESGDGVNLCALAGMSKLYLNVGSGEKNE